MRSKQLSLIILSVFILSGCFNAEEEKQKVSESIEPFYESLLFENIDETMVYFSSNSETYYNTYQAYLEQFENYNLLYDPTGVSFQEISKERILTDVNVTITGVGPSKEKIHREVIHQLEYQMDSSGVWKIHSLNETPVN